MDETNNYQSTKKKKCDFTFFFIFNSLPPNENSSTSLCCGNSELIRVSLDITPTKIIAMLLISRNIVSPVIAALSDPPSRRLQAVIKK